MGSGTTGGSRTPPAKARPRRGVRVSLLDGFELKYEERVVEVPLSVQRLVAFLALHDRSLRRSFVSGSLWPDTTDEHASANLRTALWRLHRVGGNPVQSSRSHLWMSPWVSVDVRKTGQWAGRLIDDPEVGATSDFAIRSLSSDLLPDWYEDWVLIERERFHELRLHALEALAAHLIAVGKSSHAIEAAQAAIAGDPLRESAWAVLIRAHFAEGNVGEAFRLHEAYQRRVAEELGVEPSEEFKGLIDSFTTSRVMNRVAAREGA